MMKEEIIKILSPYGIEYGFCDFEKVKPHLIECSAKRRIPQNAKTVISMVFPYLLGEELYENMNISRYAAVPDYHIVAGKYLEKICLELKEKFPKEEFEFFADNSPVNEVYTASLSGLGRVGRHGLLITPRYGSWVFIGEIVTTLKIEAEDREISRCENCGKCVEACPTGALDGENFEKSICLSEISQKKGDIDREYQLLMKKYGCAWGCDICQAVCPENVNTEKSKIPEFLEKFSPVAKEDTDIRGRAFSWRGEKVIKRNLKIINEDFSDK